MSLKIARFQATLPGTPGVLLVFCFKLVIFILLSLFSCLFPSFFVSFAPVSEAKLLKQQTLCGQQTLRVRAGWDGGDVTAVGTRGAGSEGSGCGDGWMDGWMGPALCPPLQDALQVRGWLVALLLGWDLGLIHPWLGICYWGGAE